MRLIKLAFRGKGHELRVIAPRLPVQALPGDYTLFVIDSQGVPSIAKHLRVVDDADKRGNRGPGGL